MWPPSTVTKFEPVATFLHEHPHNATWWEQPSIARLVGEEGIYVTVGDQCQFGAEAQRGEHRGQPIKKPTKFCTNSEVLYERLSRRCTGHGGECSRPSGGHHVTCFGNVAKDAALYPLKLCSRLRGRSQEPQPRHSASSARNLDTELSVVQAKLLQLEHASRRHVEHTEQTMKPKTKEEIDKEPLKVRCRKLGEVVVQTKVPDAQRMMSHSPQRRHSWLRRPHAMAQSTRATVRPEPVCVRRTGAL